MALNLPAKLTMSLSDEFSVRKKIINLLQTIESREICLLPANENNSRKFSRDIYDSIDWIEVISSTEYENVPCEKQNSLAFGWF